MPISGGPRVQDIERPGDIQALSGPAHGRGVRPDVEPEPGIRGAEGLQWIGGHEGWRRHVGQHPAVRTPELQRAVGMSDDPITILVHGAVMAATEQREIRERRRAPGRPVPDVMALAEP